MFKYLLQEGWNMSQKNIIHIPNPKKNSKDPGYLFRSHTHTNKLEYYV